MKVFRFILLFLLPLQALADENTLKVGFIVPLSGPLAEYGVAIKNGFEMAAKEFPAYASRIPTIFEDSKYDTKTSIGNFAKLHEIDKVEIVLVFGGPMSEALAPVADAKKLPTLLSTNEPTVVKNRKYSIRFSNPAKDYGGLLAAWLSKRGAKRVGIVKTDNQYLNAMFTGLTDTVPKGMEVELIDSYRYEDQDFRSSVTKLKRKPVDAIGLYLLNGQVSSFLKMMRQQQIDVPVFGTDFFESRAEIQQSLGGMEGSVFPNNGVSEAFHEEYMKLFGTDSQITWAGYGHDMFILIKEYLRINGSKKLSPEDVMTAIRALPVFEGVMGKCSYASTAEGDSYFGFPVEMKVIKGNEIKTFKE